MDSGPHDGNDAVVVSIPAQRVMDGAATPDGDTILMALWESRDNLLAWYEANRRSADDTLRDATVARLVATEEAISRSLATGPMGLRVQANLLVALNEEQVPDDTSLLGCLARQMLAGIEALARRSEAARPRA